MRWAAALLAVLALGGCDLFAIPIQSRGNRVEADQLRELTPGTSTRADVVALIGTPTTKAPFDDNTWIYIGLVTRTRVARTPGILSQDTTVLSFDDRGILRTVETRTAADALPVSVSRRTTPSPGTEASFMQQLLGNIGKFNTSAPGGGGPAGGAPGAGAH